ncbi:LacI family DNA-binding transcriptional regulator [Oceanobacillus salinisoli]|uniref:LacI family DNA-binding transcriptional regulator n=1 Tax=Oceanobacillus salinisoli TaxID=2678611 RepID=UPI0018CC49BA|nr:LacI family DNA-binding transcriptional regulator [Oceanobacillus salinisoli]
MVNIRDVSKKAGVSVATVSRVLNNKDVKKETFEHVMSVMEEMKYKPNSVARSLSKKQTNTIALIFPVVSNPFFPKLASSIENEAHEKGYKVILCNTDDNPEKLRNFIDSINDGFADGVIFSSHLLDEAGLNTLKNSGIPVVSIDRNNFNNEFSSISVNNKMGGGLATEHLIEIGCKKIGHLRGPEDEITATNRYWGYRSVLKENGGMDPSLVALGYYTVEGGYQGMKELFIRHPDIDGVFAANDLTAIGAMKAAYEWNRKIPDDLSIVGFDGIDMVRYMIPSITTIQQPINEMGKLAVNELIRKIEEEDEEINNYELDVRLIQNDSTLR